MSERQEHAMLTIRPTPDEIIETCFRLFRVNDEDRRSNLAPAVNARGLASCLLVDLCGMSSKEVARAMGMGSHSSALDAIKRWGVRRDNGDRWPGSSGPLLQEIEAAVRGSLMELAGIHSD